MRALRRDPRSSDAFPQDVLELQGYLGDRSRIPGVEAVPGKGSQVPLYILGSSLFGAKLAAALGLPYAFASHFAPAELLAAITAYRDEFQPSEQLDAPYVMAGVNVIVAETTAAAHEELMGIRRVRALSLFGRRLGVPMEDLTDEQADQLLAAGASAQVDHMMTYTAAGTPPEVGEYLDDFLRLTAADELITVHQAPTTEGRLRSVTLLAEAVQTVTV
jgi:luciferase family oxidoreductase group 1